MSRQPPLYSTGALQPQYRSKRRAGHVLPRLAAPRWHHRRLAVSINGGTGEVEADWKLGQSVTEVPLQLSFESSDLCSVFKAGAVVEVPVFGCSDVGHPVLGKAFRRSSECLPTARPASAQAAAVAAAAQT